MNIDLFIKKYSKLIYKICFDMLSDTKDAEDLTQETYLALYCNFSKYRDLSENELKNITCKIALNKCRDYLKSNIKKIEKSTNDDPDVLMLYRVPDDLDLEKKVYIDENNSYIQRKIKDLREPYKTIIYEYYIKELSLDELAKRQKVSKQTLKTQLYRARSILREKIKEDGGDEFL